jgi:hypothetical protein
VVGWLRVVFDCRDVVLKRIEAYTVKHHNKGPDGELVEPQAETAPARRAGGVLQQAASSLLKYSRCLP